MRYKAHVALVLVLLMALPAFPPAAAAPAVDIASPADKSVLLAGSVAINGTAVGSTVEWTETLSEDFAQGTLENLTNNASGTLLLNRTVYDSFDGGAIDPGRWTASQQNGVAASVSGGKLLFQGSGQSDGWASGAMLVSTVAVSDRINGTLEQFTEVGTASFSVIGLWQDSSHYIAVGRGFDFFGMGPGERAVLVSSVAGCYTFESLGQALNAPHVFGINYDGSTAALLMDGGQLATRSISLSSPRCMLAAAVCATNEFVSAAWDNINCLYVNSGMYTSSAYDTLTEAPDLLSVAWTATVPAGLSLNVQLRTDDAADMAGATNWLDVANGQSSGLPAMKQFLQFRALFSSPAGNGTPLFRDIIVKYVCGVRTVEISIDNRASWVTADGRESWNVTLDMPDGPGLIWARVTDVTGETAVTSVGLDIDTTAPTLGLAINDMAELTPTPEVNLTLVARDSYGVPLMMVSNDENFTGAAWLSFTGRLEWRLPAGDGPKTVYARVKDSNGWESEVASATIKVDTVPPVGSVRINAGGQYAKSVAVTLYLNASDASGVTDMMLSNNNLFSGSDWIPYSPVYSWSLAPGTGMRSVFCRFRDTAGHVSETASASVQLDSVLPDFTFSIENGSAFSRAYDVELELNASDNNALGEAMVSPNGQFSGAAWEPWTAVRRWTITTGEGQAMLYAKVRDAAGNEAQPQSASLVVDTVAPLCVVSSLPPVTQSETFTVGWNGNDATTGIVGYDVQYREGTGDWVDWMTGTMNTTAVFTGRDGLNYTFRARARDLAGNVGAYPENPKTTTAIRLQAAGPLPPVVSVLTPLSSAPYKGKVKFDGTARALAPGRSIVTVQWKIDNGAWLNAAGKENWSFEWNTAGAQRGPHSLRVRSFDGTNYSAEAVRTVQVDNPEVTTGGGGPDLMPILAILVVLVVVVAGVTVIVMRRKKAMPAGETATAAAARPPGEAAPMPPMPAGEPPSAEPVGPGEEEDSGEEAPAEAAAVPPGGPGGEAAPAQPASDAAAGTGAAAGPAAETAATLSVDTGGQATAAEPAPSALPPLEPGPRPPLELVRQVDPASIRSVVQAIHPSLPGELRFMPPEDITELIVTGEQGKTKTGEPLVLIMERWYFADENKPNFLQRYNW